MSGDEHTTTTHVARTLYLVRHAQSEANRDNVYPAADTPLTPLGESQARAAASWCAQQTFTAVYASPLVRAQQTAHFLGVTAETVDALRDHDVGILTGKPFGTYESVCAAAGASLDTFTPEGGESYAAVRARVSTWLSSLPTSGTILIVAHSDVLAWIVLELTGASPRESYEHVALWVIAENALTRTNWKPWLS